MSDMFNFLWGLISGMVPPKIEGNPELTAYLRSNSLLNITILVVGTFHIAWVCGYLPGNPGVAWAQEVRDDKTDLDGKIRQQADMSARRQKHLEMSLDNLTLLSVKLNLKSAVHDLCEAEESHNQLALNSASGAIDNLADQYRKLTGYPYQIPDCREVLVGK